MPCFIHFLLQYLREGRTAKAVEETEAAEGESRTDATSLLDDAVLRVIIQYVGERSFRSVAGISRRFRKAYQEVFDTCTTSAEEMVSTVSGAELFCQEARSESRFLFYEQELSPYIVGSSRCKPLSFIINTAALSGLLDVLQWAVARGHPLNDPVTAALAAYGGNLQVLQWIIVEKKCQRDWLTCTAAAAGGHLAILQWARANGCPWDAPTCTAAARNGHLVVLQWARGHGCPWCIRTCAAAAADGHLAVLQWAVANGCPWDITTRTAAAMNGHLAVLQWAEANGCP